MQTKGSLSLVMRGGSKKKVEVAMLIIWDWMVLDEIQMTLHSSEGN